MPTDNSPQFLLQSLPLFSTGLGVLRTHLALTHPPPATHVAILYHGVRFTHIAWKGVGAHGCPLQPVCDLSMQLAGHNRHRCDPPFTHAPCLFSTGMPDNGFATYWVKGQRFFSSRVLGTGMASHLAASYQKVRLTHTAWNGMGARGCPFQPVCDFSMQPAGRNRHGHDPPFTHAPCLYSTSLLGNRLATYCTRGQDFLFSRHPRTRMTSQQEASVASQSSLG